jgi:hypothetical protein
MYLNMHSSVCFITTHYVYTIIPSHWCFKWSPSWKTSKLRCDGRKYCHVYKFANSWMLVWHFVLFRPFPWPSYNYSLYKFITHKPVSCLLVLNCSCRCNCLCNWLFWTVVSAQLNFWTDSLLNWNCDFWTDSVLDWDWTLSSLNWKFGSIPLRKN